MPNILPAMATKATAVVTMLSTCIAVANCTQSEPDHVLTAEVGV